MHEQPLGTDNTTYSDATAVAAPVVDAPTPPMANEEPVVAPNKPPVAGAAAVAGAGVAPNKPPAAGAGAGVAPNKLPAAAGAGAGVAPNKLPPPTEPNGLALGAGAVPVNEKPPAAGVPPSEKPVAMASSRFDGLCASVSVSYSVKT